MAEIEVFRAADRLLDRLGETSMTLREEGRGALQAYVLACLRLQDVSDPPRRLIIGEAPPEPHP